MHVEPSLEDGCSAEGALLVIAALCVSLSPYVAVIVGWTLQAPKQ